MRRYNIDKLFDLAAGIQMGTAVGIAKVPREDSKLSELKFFELIRAEMAALGLIVSLNQIDRIIKRSAEGDIELKRLREDFRILQTVTEDELKSFCFLSLSADECHKFEAGAGVWGETVVAAFPSLAYDIDEAAKCYALGRSTASVFHSIRCLEGGIAALSRCLGIPDPTKASQRSWMKLLGTLQNELIRRWPTSSDRMHGDGMMFEEAYAALAAMQNPWRNSTMHLDKTFTEQEAAHLMDLIGGFLRRIAVRMDEAGMPLAEEQR